MIFLHNTVGNVAIIKSTHDDGCLHICACVMLLFGWFFLNKVLHSAEMLFCLTTDNQLIPTSFSKNLFPFYLGDFSEVPGESGGFSSDSGEEGSDKLGACWWRGKTCWQGKLPTVLQLGLCVTRTSLAEQDTFTPSLLPGRKRKASWATDALSTLLMGICYKESFFQLHSFLGLVSPLLFTFQ